MAINGIVVFTAPASGNTIVETTPNGFLPAGTQLKEAINLTTGVGISLATVVEPDSPQTDTVVYTGGATTDDKIMVIF